MKNSRLTKEVFFSFYQKYEYALISILVLIPNLIALWYSKKLFLETDAYEHSMRLLDFIESKRWQETIFLHDNYPFGQYLHFTRIMDLFLLVPALPFLPFMETKQAVLYGGMLYNPMIAILSVCAIIWATKPYFGIKLRLFTATHYFIYAPVVSLFLIGRPDHHVLLNLFFILQLGAFLYGFQSNKENAFKLAGVFAGLSIWVSPEGFLASLIILAGLSFCWLLSWQKIKEIRLYTLFLTITSFVCLAINPSHNGILFAENGRLSILFVVVFALATLCYFFIEFLESKGGAKSFVSKLFFISFLSFFAFGFLLSLFGANAIFSSPIPTELYDIWAKHISELQPIFFQKRAFAFIRLFVILFAISFVGLYFAKQEQKKIIFILMTIVFAFFVASLTSQRFSRDLGVFYIFLISFIVFSFSEKFSFFKRLDLKIGTIVFASLFLCFGLGLTYLLKTGGAYVEKDIVDAKVFIPYLSTQKGSILASSSSGPMLAWGTGVPVVGSPYHSNVKGIKAAYFALNGKDSRSSKELLKEHLVKTIILENPYAKLEKELKDKVTINVPGLAGKLISKENIPCYIQSVKIKEDELAEKYFIYHVDFKKCVAVD